MLSGIENDERVAKGADIVSMASMDDGGTSIGVMATLCAMSICSISFQEK